MTKYVVLIGCNYMNAEGAAVRREPGELVDDMPEAVVAALAGAIATEAEMDAMAGDAAPTEAAQAAQDKPSRKRPAKDKE